MRLMQCSRYDPVRGDHKSLINNDCDLHFYILFECWYGATLGMWLHALLHSLPALSGVSVLLVSLPQLPTPHVRILLTTCKWDKEKLLER